MFFYFTGTGNSLYAAQKLQEQLGGELHFIPQLIRNNQFEFTVAADEYIGFVFPVYYLGLPDIVKRFVSQLCIKRADSKKTIILATMAKTTGTACEVLKDLLHDRGISVGYTFSVQMPENSLFRMPTKEEVHRHLDRADIVLQGIIDRIMSGETGDYNKYKGWMPGFLSPLMYKRYIQRNKKQFSANDNCTGCGLCERICPVNTIKITDGVPNWNGKQCELCLACLHRCPAGAIHFQKKGLLLRGQYINPRVILPEFLP